MSRVRYAFATILATASVFSVSNAASPDPGQVYGMNFTSIRYFQPVYYFNNAMIQSQRWLNSSNIGNVTLDANGWPSNLNGETSVGIPYFLANGNVYPTGNWVLEWDGTGELALLGHGGSPNPPLVQSGTNRRVYNIADNSYDGFRVMWISTATAPNNVTNARLWMPGQEDSSDLLHPDVVADHEGVQVIRSMDLSETNGSNQVNWADRTLPDSPIQVPLAWEHIIEIANQMQSDLWVCLPHATVLAPNPNPRTTDYVTNLAALINSNLDSNLRVWVEYSNEVWNYNQPFSIQSNYVLNTFPGANLDEQYAFAASTVFDAFVNEFGNTDRIVRVIATQTASQVRASRRLAAVNGNVDALAITSYFGNGTATSQWIANNWPVTNQQFHDFLYNDINNDEGGNWEDNALTAATYGVSLVTYEGHSHVVGNTGILNQTQLDFVADFHTTQLSADLYRYSLDYLSLLGLETHTAFINYGRVANDWWGHREYTGQSLTEAHMWRELLDWVDDQSGTNQAPVADLSANVTSGTTPLNVNFDATGSSDPDSDPLDYEWDFDDGNGFVSGNSTESVTFSTVGTYDVVVRVSDGSLDDTDTMQIQVSSGGGQEVIIDNNDPEVTYTGNWWTSTSGNGDFYGTSFNTTHGQSSYGVRSVEYAPALANGSYDVYVHYVSGWNQLDTVRYTVNHANGSANYFVDQSSGGGSWVHIATHSMDASSTVVLDANVAGSGRPCADAVRFVPVANSIPNITTNTLPDATQGTSYSQALAATGGDGTLTWSVASGSLPAGLSLSSAGTISGTPTSSGTSTFTVEAEDTDSDTDTQALSITVISSGFSFLQLEIISGISGQTEGRIAEIDWMEGATSYPTSHFTGSSALVTHTGNAGWEALDGSTAAGSFWKLLNSTSGTITLELASGTASLDAIRIQPVNETRAPASFIVRGSTDGTNWTVLTTETGLTATDWVNAGNDMTFTF